MSVVLGLRDREARALGEAPVPREALSTHEVGYIARRARELLRPYVGDERCPKMRSLDERRVA